MPENVGSNPEAPKDSDAESREAETARLREIRARIAEIDPDVAGWDLEDSEIRLALVLSDAILFRGASVTLKTPDSSGGTEIAEIEAMDEDPSEDGAGSNIHISSSTGPYSDEHAEFAAVVVALSTDVDAELADLQDDE